MAEKKDKKRVGVLRGGIGDYYETSLKEGGHIISHILDLSDKWKSVDILIDKEGVWHAGGVPIRPTDLMDKVDVVWNVSHPNFSQALKDFIPFVRTNSFSRTLQESRTILENHMKAIGVKMPKHIILPLYQEDFDGRRDEYALKKAKEVFEKFPSPWIIKTLTYDPNAGVHVAKTFPELAYAIEDISQHQKSILVEELISGKNAFMHTVSDFRGENVYIFPAGNVSIREKVPTSRFEKSGVGIPTESVGKKLEEIAKNLHGHLENPNYLKSNFVLNNKRGIFLTSVEFLPDLGRNSHFSRSCESVGAKMHHVVEHILERTFNEGR